MRVLIWIFVAYFVIMEIRQAIISGLKAYFTIVWNYMDLCLYSSVIVGEILLGRFAVTVDSDSTYNQTA